MATDAEWLSFGHDDQLTKAVESARIRASTVATLHQLWRLQLRGVVVSSPLFARGVVYATSEAGDVVAALAGSGTILWQRTLHVMSFPGCGSWGISSTPALDLSRGLLYVVGAGGKLHALSISTGREAPGFPVVVTSIPDEEYVWGGLRILGNRLLVPVGSYCDAPDANNALATGRLLSVNLDDPSDVRTFQTVEGPGHLGSIWGYSGTSIEPDGSAIYTGVGNSAAVDPSCGCVLDNLGYGDHVVKLRPDLTVVDSNDPGVPNNGADDDFGAAPLLIQPAGCPPLAIAANKDGYLYAWNRQDIAAGPVASLGIGDPGGSPFLDSPAWSESRRMLYVAGTRAPANWSVPRLGEGVTAIHIDDACHFDIAWTAPTGGGPQSPPIVVNDVVFASGGDSDVVGLDAATGRELWRAKTSGPTFAPPIEAAGTLFAPDGNALVAWSP